MPVIIMTVTNSSAIMVAMKLYVGSPLNCIANSRLPKSDSMGTIIMRRIASPYNGVHNQRMNHQPVTASTKPTPLPKMRLCQT